MGTRSVIGAMWLFVASGVMAAETGKGEGKQENGPLHEHPTLVHMLRENNRLRATVGLPPQEISPELTKAAQDHAWYMARTGNFSHHANGGPTGRAARHGFDGSVAENIAMGHTTVREVFRGWRASSGHWSNIVSSHKYAGFGYGISSGGAQYWVAVYGN